MSITASNGHAVIRAKDLVKTYHLVSGPVHALKGVTFEIKRGEFVSIMGQSGSGKSTLLHVLGGLHQPSEGLYEVDGIDVSDLNDEQLSQFRNEKIGFVFQKFNLLSQEDIVDNVALPLVYARIPLEERQRRAKKVLSMVGLGDRLHHKPSELSGGQSQRVAIARALVTDPAVILADEPTGNLDSRTGQDVMAVFQTLHRAGCTIIQVTHDREKAEYTDRVIHLKDGLVDREEIIENSRKAHEVNMD